MRHITLLVILFLSGNTIFAQEKWKLIDNSDGMKIYTREYEGSNFKELKISFTINAPLSSIVSVLDEIDKYPQWIYTCTESKVIEPKVDGKSTYYVLMDLPWPVSDRDMVLKSKMVQDPITLEISVDSKAISGEVAEKKDVIRILKNNISWRMKPISKNQTHIDYYVKSKPSGSVPSWLGNMTVDLGPKKTMMALKERAEKKVVPADKIYIIDFK